MLFIMKIVVLICYKNPYEALYFVLSEATYTLYIVCYSMLRDCK